MRFYFVRHGKTQWNLEGKYQGANGDSPLLPESYRDIHYLAKFLTGKRIDHIYTSPIKRAYLTAKTLDDDLGGKIPLTTNDAIKEFDLGDLEGRKFVDVEKKFPKLIWAFRHDPSQYDAKIVHGESFEQVIARSDGFLKDLAADPNAGDKVYLIVSHGAALTAMTRSLLGVPLKDLRKNGGMSNTGLTTIDTYDHGKTFKLIKWNDTSYLHRQLSSTDTI